jgi:GMP synthase (glutamine-hydrolysing)
MNSNVVAIIDFGSQTTQLIARRVRELQVFSVVLPSTVTLEELGHKKPAAIILSGGPSSVADCASLAFDERILSMNVPVLGICFGMQLLVRHFGGEVYKAEASEFGLRTLAINTNSALFSGLKEQAAVWMSHFDQCRLNQEGFRIIGSSDTCPTAAIENKSRRIYGVQFHVEVSHTENGTQILHNFLFGIAKLKPDYVLEMALQQKILDIRKTVGSKQVLLGLSGGVDSSVAAFLISRAIGQQLHCVFVNHGFHRHGEVEEVERIFSQVVDARLTIIDAREQFFTALTGVHDPEEKRKIIGRVFVEVFEKEAESCGNVAFLAQGTIYSDVIESQKTATHHAIKSHHNVGGLPERMNLKLLEPLRYLFKDEVRQWGLALGLSPEVVFRQPFPGPGLAIRIPGPVSPKLTETLRQADKIVLQEVALAQAEGLLPKLWQWFAVLLPVKSVGVKGDARSYGNACVVRVVQSEDAMTADWARLPYDLIAKISSRITNEVSDITRVLYDVTQKPPGTIEWE